MSEFQSISALNAEGVDAVSELVDQGGKKDGVSKKLKALVFRGFGRAD